VSTQYNVSTLLEEPVGATREFEVDDGVLMDEEEPRHQHIVGHATLLRTKHGVLVTARLQGVQSERCSRCLQELDIPLEIDIEEEFLAGGEATTGPGQSTAATREAFRIDVHHTLDLEEAVRQYWTSALPMQPVCRSDCRGLCPHCGQDLNERACSCAPEEDERWSALRQLVRKSEGS
jgi:uncharacterized protein